jgi:short-subunit dehydrogenase
MNLILLEYHQLFNMKKVLILGSNGGIGTAVAKQYNKKKYEIISLNRDIIDWNGRCNSQTTLNNFLDITNPDIIINCIGKLECDNVEDIFNINLKPSYELFQFYKLNPPKKTIKLILIGSTSYNRGHRDYILYSCTKAALWSLYLSINDYFNYNKNKLIVGIINLPRVDTKMIQHLESYNKNLSLTPKEVSKKIIKFVKKLKNNSSINIKEKK